MNAGKLDIVRAETKKMDIDVLGLSETRWTRTGYFKSGKHRVMFSGHKKLKERGVDIVCSERTLNSILEFEVIYDRLIS